MKKSTLFGFLVGILVFVLYTNGSDLYNRLVGPTVEHRQDGIISYKGDNFHAIDPTSKLVVNKDLSLSGSPKVYLDIEPNGVQYAKWKSNNISNYEAELHLKPPTNDEEKKNVERYKKSETSSIEIIMVMAILILAVIGVFTVLHFIFEDIL